MCQIYAPPSPSLPRNLVDRNVLLDVCPDPGRWGHPCILLSLLVRISKNITFTFAELYSRLFKIYLILKTIL